VIATDEIEIRTAGRGFIELTDEINAAVRRSGIKTGLCSAFIRHTSASLLMCENADPEVLRDLERFMHRLVPDGDGLFRHDAEGPDDMPAHVRSVLTTSDVTVPVRGRAITLGTWQGVYLWEHRADSHRRIVEITTIGEP
jgi:secondary thiamine-phosphate synthase enzyme